MTNNSDEVQDKVLAEFARELGVADLGLRDNYFGSGGSSLGALRMIGRLRRTLDPSLSLIDVFQNPTAQSLSTVILERRAGATDAHDHPGADAVSP